MSQDILDSSINAPNNTGTQTWFNLSVSDDAKRHIIVWLLALSVIVNMSCLWMFDILKSEMRTKEYDLDYFRSHEFADLKAKIEADHQANQVIIATLSNRSK